MRNRRRSAWNPATWTPATSSFSANRPTPGVRRFASTEHLAPEAVAAFADGELGMSAHARAMNHLTMCPECAAAVDAQLAARTRLRTAGEVSIPLDLLGQLSEIPTKEIDIPRLSEHPTVSPDAPTDRRQMPRGRPTWRRGR